MSSTLQFLYRIQPARTAMLTEGSTPEEAELVSQHFGRLERLMQEGVITLAGRTLSTDASTFGIVIFNAASEETARALMNDDPPVRSGVFSAELFPYRVALIEAGMRVSTDLLSGYNYKIVNYLEYIMAAALPQIEHIYQNHILDSTRWQHFQPRTEDIVVATPYKCGTTWMQTIVMYLVFQDLQVRDVDKFSPWLDRRIDPLDDIISQLEAQEHRRCVKSHLPLDGLRYLPQVKYIVVGRDARDVFMSMWNHHSNYTPEVYEAFNNAPGRVGDPLPQCPATAREFWLDWISRGWFAWESEGYPYWSNMRHVQTWWNYRHLPNLLFVHYNDLLSDLPGEIRRVADYLSIDLSPDMLAAIAEAVRFDSMKQNAEKIVPGAQSAWVGGSQTFINKGTNGRWRDVLTEDDLKLYDAAVARELTPDCATWLEHGRLENT